MNKLRSLKRPLVCGFATALIASSTLAIPSDRLAELQAKAEAGNGISQYNLGLVYATPDEPIANIIEAYVWFSLAADNGAPGKALMIVTNQMTPEQISDGKKLLEQRRADLAAHRPIVAAASTKTVEPAKPAPLVSPVVAAAPEPDVTAIQSELKKTSEQLATATKENQQLKAERDQLTATAATNTNEISTMRAAAANFEGERNALQQKIADASNQSNSLVAAELAQTKQSLAASEKALNEANTELLKNQASLAEAATKAAAVAVMHTELMTHRQVSADLGKQLEKTTAEKDAALAQAAKTTTDAQLQIDELNAKLKTSEETASKTVNENHDLNQQLAALKAAPPKQDVETLNQLAKLSAELQTTQRTATAEKETLSTQLKSTEETSAKAMAENAALAQQLALLKAAPPHDPEAQARLEKLNADLEALQRATDDEKKVLILKAQANTAELESTHKEIEELQSKLKDSESALGAAKIATAAAIAATPEQASPELQKELSETKLKLDVSLRSYQLQQAEVDKLQNALANIENERAKTAERLQVATAEAANAASRAAANSDASVQLAGVREQLRQTQNQLASIAYENTELKHRLSSLAPNQMATLTPLPTTNPSAAPSRPSATKAAPVAEQAAAPATRTHTVVTGDTLSTIAKRYYGSASRWTEIMEANKGTLRDPAALKVGMKLKIP
jgi:nucleoid-associated protein YgaU/TPR repeat protein